MAVGLLATVVRAEDPLRWLSHIRPKASEIGGITWLPSLWDGVEKAHRAKKPILLWAMNGHPLACT